MTNSHSSSWKESYIVALNEPDKEKLTELVYATELAMVFRLQEPADSADGHKERVEIAAASENLLALKTLILSWPSPPTRVVPSSELAVAMKGKYRRSTTSLYLIESREAEKKLAEARKKKKALARKPAKVR